MSRGRGSAAPASGVALCAIDAPDFDLDLTLSCGQVFHWQRCGDGWIGAIGDAPFYVEQRRAQLLVPSGGEALARRYFALDHPLPEIYATFPSDPAMTAALDFCRGLRIVRQPVWECLATFITSSMKQVAHIAQISHTLRQRFGSEVSFGVRRWTLDVSVASPPPPARLSRKASAQRFPLPLFAYPSPERLAALSEPDLRACSLGYRAKTLLGSARMLAEGAVDLQAVSRMDDDAARTELRRLPGVGEKVANCVLLFAFERLRAFPIDVWIERVLREIYFPRKRKVTARQLRDFSFQHFGEFGGYAQQYLFHHARKTWRK